MYRVSESARNWDCTNICLESEIEDALWKVHQHGALGLM